MKTHYKIESQQSHVKCCKLIGIFLDNTDPVHFYKCENHPDKLILSRQTNYDNTFIIHDSDLSNLVNIDLFRKRIKPVINKRYAAINNDYKGFVFDYKELHDIYKEDGLFSYVSNFENQTDSEHKKMTLDEFKKLADYDNPLTKLCIKLFESSGYFNHITFKTELIVEPIIIDPIEYFKSQFKRTIKL